MEKPSLAELQSQVDAFNKKHPVGSVVYIKPDSNSEKLEVMHVRHEATILGGHSAVGWFEESQSCYSLNFVVE